MSKVIELNSHKVVQIIQRFRENITDMIDLEFDNFYIIF